MCCEQAIHVVYHLHGPVYSIVWLRGVTDALMCACSLARSGVVFLTNLVAVAVTSLRPVRANVQRRPGQFRPAVRNARPPL